jgi:hypothetical protein
MNNTTKILPTGETDPPAARPEPEPPVQLNRRGLTVALGLALVVGVVLIAMIREIQAPALTPPITAASAAAELGYFLGRWGLALILIGFVPLLVIQVMRAFAWKASAETATTDLPGTDLWKQVIDGLPNLIKTPIGVGMGLILISALLLLGTSLGSEDVDATPTPEPTANP